MKRYQITYTATKSFQLIVGESEDPQQVAAARLDQASWDDGRLVVEPCNAEALEHYREIHGCDPAPLSVCAGAGPVAFAIQALRASVER